MGAPRSQYRLQENEEEKTGNAFHVSVGDLEGKKQRNFRAQRDLGPVLGGSHPRSHSSESFRPCPLLCSALLSAAPCCYALLPVFCLLPVYCYDVFSFFFLMNGSPPDTFFQKKTILQVVQLCYS
jgi:hypothetical protein